MAILLLKGVQMRLSLRRFFQADPKGVAAVIAGMFAAFFMISARVLPRLVSIHHGYGIETLSVLTFLVVYRIMIRMQMCERQREGSDARFRSLVEASIAGIYMIQDGRFIYTNPRMEEMFGYSSGGIIGKTVPELVAPEDRTLVKENIRKRETGEKQSIRYEFRGIRQDGRVIDVEVLGAAADIDGKLSIVGTILDQTERNLLQKEFAQSQKMESIGRLAGGVAHDFNNILTAIAGYCHFLIESLDETDPRRSDVEEIKKAEERASSLTRQLLAYSRKQVLRPRILDLNDLVQNMEKMLLRLIGEEINLVAVAGEHLGRVKADPGQIEQALMNLVVNSRDAMPRGGKITIETANVQLGEYYARSHPGVQPGAYVMLAVSDTGWGMDKNTLSKLFEPFFTTKETGKGTGLGLPTVYGIVKQSGGTIYVYSEPGQGTTFKLYFPRIDGAADEIPAVSPESRSNHIDGTILLVEDDDAVRKLYQRVLSQAGFSVLTAANGKEALVFIQNPQQPLDLLLTDIVMPAMRGDELIKHASIIRPRLKRILMSGHTEIGSASQELLEPNETFLQKPLEPALLLSAIREKLTPS